MKIHDLRKFQGGWLVGFFEKSIIPKCNGFEVAVKRYRKGDVDKAHLHKVATEITAVVYGIFKISEHQLLCPDDVMVLEPGEAMLGDWECVSDSGCTVCIKVPSVPNDKYPVRSGDKK